jgi:uncharacterized protein (TIGR02145 family)
LNGTVNANYLSTIVTFEYGTTTSFGSTATTTQNPITGNTVTNVSADITGLTVATTYHYRIKATNSNGTTYGSDLTFTTKYSGTVTDVDGNIYNAISIGTQIWMKENLGTTKYRNGDLIGTTTPATLDITSESTPKYQWAYAGNESNVATYGRLYTWYATTDSRNICPDGWHLPTDAEWTTLENYLIANGYNFDGTTSGNKIAKSLASSSGWGTSTNTGAVGNNDYTVKRNATDFTALPGGIRYNGKTFISFSDTCIMWSATENLAPNAWSRALGSHRSQVFRNPEIKNEGQSVRCLKDN